MLILIFLIITLTFYLIVINLPLSSLRTPAFWKLHWHALHDMLSLTLSHACVSNVIICNQCFSWIKMSRAPLPASDHNHSQRAICKRVVGVDSELFYCCGLEACWHLWVGSYISSEKTLMHKFSSVKKSQSKSGLSRSKAFNFEYLIIPSLID